MKHFVISSALASMLAASAAHAQDATTAPTTTPTTPPPPTTTAPPPPPVQAAPTSAQMENGFVLETHFYAQLVSFPVGLGTTLNLPLLTGGFFAGYKLDRLMVGLGYNFSSYDAGGAQIVMTWLPGVRFAILRSSDDRVELFGQFDFGIGHDFGSAQSNEQFSPDLGVGVRYWVNRQFAISSVTGWNGQWNVTQNPSGSVVLQGIFAGLQVVGVF